MKKHIAYFITPHGFGHAARAIAVMSAMLEKDNQVEFELFTQIPQWFFDETIPGKYHYHSCTVDVGLVQSTPLREDVSGTVEKLNSIYPVQTSIFENLTATIKETHCVAIMCDISPLGIAAAQAVGLPSILIENFTWDWIYEGYLPEDQRLQRYIDYLKILFKSASYHIQTAPVCLPDNKANFVSNPVSRKPRLGPDDIRQRLGIRDQLPIILVTMGGIQSQFQNLRNLAGERSFHIVIPGGSNTVEQIDHLTLLPHHSNFYHPDLIYASEAVVGKVGYSTLAETYHANSRFVYISRPRFRETTTLVNFIKEHIPGFEISETEFNEGQWFEKVNSLIQQPRREQTFPNGADQIARYILNIL